LLRYASDAGRKFAGSPILYIAGRNGQDRNLVSLQQYLAAFELGRAQQRGSREVPIQTGTACDINRLWISKLVGSKLGCSFSA
jgi:hypothetical protein